MNFILTKYIYPVNDPLILSNKFNFYLDNPKTEEEIAIIKEYLDVSLNSPDFVYKRDHEYRIPIKSTKKTYNLLSVESALEGLNKNYSGLDLSVHEFFKKYRELEPLEKLARMWVIARYNDEGEYQRLKEIALEESRNGNPGFFLLDKGNPIIDNSDNLVGFTYFLSLLVHTDNEFYNGQSFILHNDSFTIQHPKVDRFFNLSVMYFGFMSYSHEIKNSEDHWKSFYHIRDELATVSKKLDDIIDNENQEKILFIANLLKVVGNNQKDESAKLVTLVSIIELLLTHSPDYNRFNIEDSISKQFRLKASLLIYQNDKSKDIEKVKNRLKEIYSQRSNIAHGNFKSFKDYLRKEAKKSKEEDISEDIILERLNNDLFNFIRAIVEEYIKDRKLVDFLKEN
ncbi:HEPN domain-containing protein [uncultured Pontibacter sp.]|uniref:HEPN domain-containing protein n=1 Tax=uncultured Pontibacter sp. TaxID=453356 RepID=UPI0026100DB7|nr:HEPN domain-containing protein [uncultured Pontibacter sp.]